MATKSERLAQEQIEKALELDKNNAQAVLVEKHASLAIALTLFEVSQTLKKLLSALEDVVMGKATE